MLECQTHMWLLLDHSSWTLEKACQFGISKSPNLPSQPRNSHQVQPHPHFSQLLFPNSPIVPGVPWNPSTCSSQNRCIGCSFCLEYPSPQISPSRFLQVTASSLEMPSLAILCKLLTLPHSQHAFAHVLMFFIVSPPSNNNVFTWLACLSLVKCQILEGRTFCYSLCGSLRCLLCLEQGRASMEYTGSIY